jgi:hypothetical protein
VQHSAFEAPMHCSRSRRQTRPETVQKMAGDLHSLRLPLAPAPLRKASPALRLRLVSAPRVALRGLLLAFGAAVLAGAATGESEMAAGLQFYEAAEFGNAAARFQMVCRRDANAEACYWTGVSYERLGDTKIPFGCSTSRKAQEYFAKAVALRPGQMEYRDGLFDFLLNYADCSRTGIRQAAEMLAATPESDPDYPRMRDRLQETVRWNKSLVSRLSNFFLLIPRATYRSAAWSAAAVGSAARQ